MSTTKNFQVEVQVEAGVVKLSCPSRVIHNTKSFMKGNQRRIQMFLLKQPLTHPSHSSSQFDPNKFQRTQSSHRNPYSPLLRAQSPVRHYLQPLSKIPMFFWSKLPIQLRILLAQALSLILVKTKITIY